MFGGFAQKKRDLRAHPRLGRQFLCVVVLVVPLSIFASEDRMDYISERLESAIEQEFIGAAVIGYYDAGEVDYQVFGRTNKDSESMPSKTTLFEIGSVTKVFTAALTQVLIDSDALSWDSTVKSSLGDWNFVSGKIRNISLRELATHSSGLPRMPLNWRAADPLDPYRGYDNRRLKAFVGQFDPPELEKKLAYSNLAFGLLGNIAANASGKSYSEAMKELVLDPLGMNHTTVGITGETRTNLALGYSYGATIPNWYFEDSLEGAGAILSSAEDMVQFIKRNVEQDDSSIYKSLKQLQHVQVQPNQAFGWTTSQNETGQQVFWIAGLTGGYASFVAISPEESKGWVLLTTSMHGGLITQIGQSFFTPIQRLEPMDFSAYLGVYKLISKMYMTITERDNQLFSQATGQVKIPLTFVKDREFTYKPDEVVLKFEKPRNGESRGVRLRQRNTNINARRVEDRFGIPNREEIEIDEETLKEYPGHYQLAPRAFLSIVFRDGQLFAEITGQPVVPIFAMGKDKFFYKQTDAEVQFERNEEGNVSGLILIQNGEYKAPKAEAGAMRAAQNPAANRPARPGTQNRSSPSRR